MIDSPGPLERAVRAACRVGTRALPRGRPGITVLAYHLVGGGTDSPVDLPFEIFRGQMEELRERRLPVMPLSRAVSALEERETLEQDWVALTFDDAYRNFDERAVPVLEELGLPATLFVPTGFVDGVCPGPLAGAEDLPPLSWQRLRELAQGGLIELGAHSRSHADLRASSDPELQDEVAGSKAVLEERAGTEPLAFCYPRALRSPRVEQVVARAYRAAVVGGGRKSRPGRTSPWLIGRVSVRREMPSLLGHLVGASVALEEWSAEKMRSWRTS